MPTGKIRLQADGLPLAGLIGLFESVGGPDVEALAHAQLLRYNSAGPSTRGKRAGFDSADVQEIGN